jgi:hypothetical protein
LVSFPHPAIQLVALFYSDKMKREKEGKERRIRKHTRIKIK